tara:strand:- start:3090 stop:3716 length:627 start_codon:yes stop_codon:yes gene_type:complete
MGFNFKKYKGAVTGDSPLHKGEKGEGSGKSITRKQHAGDVGRRATATKAQDRSGYSRSGGDYINVHSFTANTRLSPSLANTLGPSISPAVRGKGNSGSGEFELPDIDTTLANFDVTTEIVKGNNKKKRGFQEIYDEFPIVNGKRYNKSTNTYYDDLQDFKDDAAKNPSKSSGKDKVVTTVKKDGKVIIQYEGEGGDLFKQEDILEKNK